MGSYCPLFVQDTGSNQWIGFIGESSDKSIMSMWESSMLNEQRIVEMGSNGGIFEKNIKFSQTQQISKVSKKIHFFTSIRKGRNSNIVDLKTFPLSK